MSREKDTEYSYFNSTGFRIKGIRKQARLTQEKFAKSLMVTRKQLWRWENNEAKPSDIYLERIAIIYNVSLEWLKSGQGEKYQTAEQVMEARALHDFMREHREIEESRPGLYSLLIDAANERSEIRESEAEYLVRVEPSGSSGEPTKETYLYELQQYRLRNELRSWAINDEELDLIKNLRSIPEEHKSLALDLIKTLLEGLKKR